MPSCSLLINTLIASIALVMTGSPVAALNLTSVDGLLIVDRAGPVADFTNQLFLQYQDQCTGVYDYVFWGTDAFYLSGFRTVSSVPIRVGNLYATAVRANAGYLELVSCGSGGNAASYQCLMFFFNNEFFLASTYADGRWIFVASSTSDPSAWLRFVHVGAYLRTATGGRFLTMATADTASGGKLKACHASPFKLILTRANNARAARAIRVRGVSTGPTQEG